jgi:hypothetical protein
MVREAALLVGLSEPDTVMAATTDEIKQFRALAQQEGDELSRWYDWRKLKTGATITGDGTTTAWDLPCDWDRQLASDALWLDASPYQPLLGPISDQEWLAYQTAASAPSRPVWRYFGDQIQTYPAIENGQAVKLEYRSAYWIASADATTIRNAWVEDSDIALVPERIMKLGIVWRWKRAKGLDYAEEFATYEKERLKAERNDAGFRTLTMREGFGDFYGRDPRRNAYRVSV